VAPHQGGFPRLHPVLALALGNIQGLIGAAQQGLGIIAGLPLRQAGAEVHRYALVLHGQHAMGQRALQALHRGHAVGARGFRQHQHELVTAEPGNTIGGAQQQPADRHQVLQQGITAGMAMGIVGLVEVIQVDHRQAQRRVVARRPCHFPLQHFVQPAPVQGLGQRIDAGQVAGLAQFLFQLGDAPLGPFHFLPRAGQVVTRLRGLLLHLAGVVHHFLQQVVEVGDAARLAQLQGIGADAVVVLTGAGGHAVHALDELAHQAAHRRL